MSEFEHISTIIKRVMEGVMDYKNAKGTGFIEGKGAAGGNILLCKNCQIWADTIQVKSHQPPWQHCHHELERLIESVEKPKEPCWCENDRRMTKIWGQIGNINKGWDILYCPYCAKKL